MFDFFKRKKPETPPPAPVQDAPRRMKIRPESVGRNKKAKDPFKPAKPPKGVVPKGAPSLGMATDEASNYAAYFNQAEYWDEDLQWLGYPLLTALAQRSEYRTIVETYAREMTRQWIKLTTAGDEDKSERIAELTKALEKYRVRDVIRMSLETDGYYGRAHIYVDMGDDSPQEVETILIRKAVKLKNKLKGFKIVEPLWTYPAEYNAIDPLSRDFYRPTSWYVNGKRVHATRLITMVARDVPNALKPAYSFGGISLTQMARPYVDNWLRSRQSVSDLLHSYSKDVLKTNMSGILNDGAADSYLARAALYNNTRDNRGLIMLDKTDEDFVNVSTPLSTVDKILAQSQEQMASVAQIPLIILLGITPTGLNASAESELDVWAQRVKAEQEKEVRPRLQDIIEIIQVAEFGEIDPSIGFEFVPLREMSELDEATIRKTEADTDAVYIQSGVLDPEDARNRIANDEKSLYHGVALQTPEPPEPPGGAFGDDEDDPPAQDGDWHEGDHPRAENGQFGSGGGSREVAAAEKGRHKVEYTDRNGRSVYQTFNSLADAHNFIRDAHPSVRKTATVSQNKPDFSASHFADRHLDSGVNEQSILAHFPPDTKSKITDRLQEVEKRQSTHEKYKDENGNYTPERQALHEKIIAHILSPEVIERARPPAGQKPTYFILGGRGGSGKSKFKELLPGVKNTVYLDADEIKGALPEYEGWNAAEVHEESGDIFDEITKRSKELGLNLVHDATMKTPKKAESLVQGFKDDGYRIEAHYMHLPRQEAAKRAVERFLNSGRLVPPAIVLGNTENEKAFDLVKELADNWSFWDNHVPRGEPPKRIASKT